MERTTAKRVVFALFKAQLREHVLGILRSLQIAVGCLGLWELHHLAHRVMVPFV